MICASCDIEEPQGKKGVTVTRQRGGHRYFDADVLEAMENRMKSTPTDARPITAWAMSLSEKAS